MERNSQGRVVKITYDDIQAYGKVKSRRIICKYLRELKSKGVIVQVNKSAYEIKPLPKVNCNYQKVNSKVNCNQQTHVFYINYNNNKQQHDKKPVVVSSKNNNLVKYEFRDASPFRDISEASLLRFTGRYGAKLVQAKITALESKYQHKSDVRNAGGLLCASLQENWYIAPPKKNKMHYEVSPQERREIEESKERERIMKEEQYQRAEKSQAEKDFEEAVKDTSLVERAYNYCRSMYGDKPTKVQAQLVKYQIIEEYRKKKQQLIAA